MFNLHITYCHIENMFSVDDVSNNKIKYIDNIWVTTKLLATENDLFNEGGKWQFLAAILAMVGLP